MKLTDEMLKRVIDEVILAEKKCKFPKGVKLGNVAEGIFAAAYAAKILEPTKPVTRDAVWTIVSQLKEAPLKGKSAKGVWETTYKPFRGEDNILKVAIEIQSQGEYDVLVDPAMRECLSDAADNSITYVNSQDWSKFALRLNGYPKKLRERKEDLVFKGVGTREKPLGEGGHVIEVSGEGVTGAGDVTADIILKVDGQPVNPLSPSLKADNKQVAQWSGDSFESQRKFFKELFGIDIPGSSEKLYKLLMNSPELEPFLDPQLGTGEDDKASRQATKDLGLNTIDLASSIIMKKALPLIQKRLESEGSAFMKDMIKSAITKSKTAEFPAIVDLGHLSVKNVNKLDALDNYTLSMDPRGSGTRFQVNFYAHPKDKDAGSKILIMSMRSAPKSESQKAGGQKTGKRKFRPNNYVQVEKGLEQVIGVGVKKQHQYDTSKEDELLGRTTQKEHLTITHGSYNMLTEMIENLMSEE